MRRIFLITKLSMETQLIELLFLLLADLPPNKDEREKLRRVLVCWRTNQKVMRRKEEEDFLLLLFGLLCRGTRRGGDLILHEEELADGLLVLVLDRVQLVDARAVVGGVTTEGDVQGLEEHVHASEQGLGRGGDGLDGGNSGVDDDAICEVGGHDEIVLDDEGGLLGVEDETLDDAGGDDTLLGIEVG